jgi:3-oxoacyl-[acyl-carrier-protein] synthase-3
MTEVSVPVAVSGVGHYVPERVVTNDHLAPLLGTTPDWIVDRSGIRERRFAAPDQTNADLALRAARIALDRAGLAPDALDMIVVATLSPDHFFPGVSAALQAGLGVTRPIPSFDLHAQCGGFIYGLGVAQGLLASGRYAHVLVVGSERQSVGLDFSPRGRDMSMLFGDGAGALVLSRQPHDDQRPFVVELFADGRFARELWMEAPGAALPAHRLTPEDIQAGRCFPAMNGKNLILHAGRKMSQAAHAVVDRAGLTLGEVDWIVPHQANLNLLTGLERALGVPAERVVKNIGRVGNTSAASIPIALSEAMASGQICKGHRVLLLGFGSGFTWGGCLFQY